LSESEADLKRLRQEAAKPRMEKEILKRGGGVLAIMHALQCKLS